MYNRYIPNDRGTYTRISEEEPRDSRAGAGGPPPGADGTSGSPGGHHGPGEHTEHGGPGEHHGPGTPPPPGPESAPPPPPRGGRVHDSVTGFLRRILDQLHLDQVDTGDLLLLIMMYLLFKEDADEELLFAMGLLLIL